ncbi:MAG TPA: hypothetical protein DCG06_02625 [Deltaproteobacteria bacterium]|nr:hypothetical protein [Deltaproteobacteria bacterium]
MSALASAPVWMPIENPRNYGSGGREFDSLRARLRSLSLAGVFSFRGHRSDDSERAVLWSPDHLTLLPVDETSLVQIERLWVLVKMRSLWGTNLGWSCYPT